MGGLLRFRGNALFALARDSLPAVDSSAVDARKELEDVLRSACASYIGATVAALAGPLQALALKGKAFVGKPPAALAAQPFAAPERAAAAAEATLTAVEANLPQALAKMALYLDSPVTQSILYKPVAAQVVAAGRDVAALLQRAQHPREALEPASAALAKVGVAVRALSP